MSREILKSIINEFDTEKFIRFFREKNRKFTPRTEMLAIYNDDDFSNCIKIGKVDFQEGTYMIICSLNTDKSLTERSGKKSQYEKGKKILKETQSDSGIFIFYDRAGNFRFSLIYANYLGKNRDWSTFKRFTYFVCKDFTNKTFLIRIGDGDFSDVEKIKEAFSVEKVTKDFYKDIAYWYFWAVKETRFPKDAEEEDKGRNMSIIRLITRIIFIWFMKERGLIQPDLFSYDKMSILLKSISKKETTYYKAILQNLFFATLNTKIKERKFRFNIKGWKNSSYMDHTIYRYEDYFKDKNDMLGLFRDIPFLNGGLFDCLDKRSEETGKITEFRYDGFSDKEIGLKVPNELFFSEEKSVDLNSDYGTKGKKYAAKGLINILSSYNFVIDENDPNDAEVALDPELLGKVFENLLASFNPETASTARKATGSYYTPREIVDYMVTQSLKEYFKTNLDGHDETEKKLDILFSTENQTNPFDTALSKKVVELTDKLRIVDPAVGSGAFPMGILNKLVYILSKLDKNNLFWKNQQIKVVEENISDPVIRQTLKNNIEEQFTDKNPDYGRKLYLIEKCIYGVDIQQIAVEIAKLRFFISLLVDENIDKTKDNWGIKPLPNLDYKIMQGNSLLEEYKGIMLIDEKILESSADEKLNLRDVLKKRQSELQSEYIDLNSKKKLTKVKAIQLTDELNKIKEQIKKLSKPGKENKDDDLFDDNKESKELFQKIKSLREEFFIESDRAKKDKLKKDIEEIEWKFIEITLKEQKKESGIGELKKIIRSNKKPYFLWHFNFGEVFNENGGFDVVIGNPPYGLVFDDNLKSALEKKYNTFKRNNDIFVAFYEKSISLLNNNSNLTLITPNTFLNGDYFKELRKFFTQQIIIKEIYDFKDNKIFQDPTVFVCILSASKTRFIKYPYTVDIKLIQDEFEKPILKTFIVKGITDLPYKTVDKVMQKITLSENIVELDSLFLVKDVGFNYWSIGKGKKRDGNSIGDRILYNGVKKNKLDKPYLKGRDILKYYIAKPTNFLKHDYKKFLDPHIDIFRYSSELLETIPKIIYRQTSNRIISTIDYAGQLCDKSNHIIIPRDMNCSIDIKYLLALLNSNLFYHLYKDISQETDARTFAQVKTVYVKKFLLKDIKKKQQQQFITLVDRILEFTKDEDYPMNEKKKSKVIDIGNQIDIMIYKLYELTYFEVKIVDPEFWMSEDEYGNFE